MVCPDCGHDSPETLAACAMCGSSSGRLTPPDGLTMPAWPGAALRDGPVSLDTPTSLAPPSVAVAGGMTPPTSFNDGTASLDTPTVIGAPAPVVQAGTFQSGSLFASRFRIERMIGAGGMGAVYKAWDQELDIPVALKIIRPDMTGDPTLARDFEQRFKRELLTARQVTHRNVVRIHDLGESGGVKFITMQFVEGRDLAAILRDGKPPFARVLSFAKQIAAGLTAAHEAGIVHRDLKPQNVLVDANDTVYLSDFGLAKSLEATRIGLTQSGQMMGTPRYISPEQIRGKDADHRSDLYALGVMMYEMATGHPPVTGNTVMDLMFKRVQEPAPDPRVLAPDLAEFFRHAVLRCLEREPAARYASAAELLADLEAGRAAPVAVSAAPRTLSLTLPVPSKRRWAIATALALLLAVLIPLVRSTLSSPPAAPQSSSAPAAIRHVAVLPFGVTGDRPELAPIAVGVTEALSAKLFGLPGLNLSSGAAVQQVKAGASHQDVARQLGATLLISGSVQGADDAMRIVVSIDDVKAGQVWAHEFSGVAGDLLTIEDQIYQGVVGALKVTPTTEQAERAVLHPTENIGAYQSYLRGRNAMRGQQNLENVRAALGFYEDARNQDPTFALAYAGISDATLRLYRATKEPAWLQQALAAADQAQQLDDKRLEVHIARASAYQQTGKTTEAIAMLTEAAQMAPTSDDVYRRLGRAYLSIGRRDEAIAAYRKAIEINPYYAVSYGALGFAFMQFGAYGDAVEAYQNQIKIDPKSVDGYNDLGAAQLQMGRYDEAADAFKKALALQPIAQTYTNLGLAYAFARKFTDAVPMFEKAVELSPKEEQWLGNLADGYRWAGQNEKATAAYEKAIALALKSLQVNPRDADVRSNLALYYAKRGDHTRARKLIADARAINRASVNVIYAEATIAALAGQEDEAFAALERAVAGGYPLQAARSDPDMQSLVSDPRFARLTAPASNR